MDWLRFLEENNIHFVTRGPNTKRGEVSIHCPLCGDEDPSEHLGISLESGKWGCLRDGSHRGKAARTLIKAILRCSSPQALLIVRQYSHSDPDSLEGALATLEADHSGTIEHDEDIAKLAARQKLGPQFNDFYRIKPRGVTKRFFNYLASRHDNPQDVIEQYDLRCAMTGRYKDRVIIPVRLNGELLGWTARALGNPISAPRYLASNEDVKTTVFNYDELKKGGQRLFIVEGPFDAMRMDNFGVQNGRRTGQYFPLSFRATCTFGTSVTISQLALLRALASKFEETWVMFDVGAEGPAAELVQWTRAGTAMLPPDIDDPGELTSFYLKQCADVSFNGWFRLPPLIDR